MDPKWSADYRPSLHEIATDEEIAVVFRLSGNAARKRRRAVTELRIRPTAAPDGAERRVAAVLAEAPDLDSLTLAKRAGVTYRSAQAFRHRLGATRGQRVVHGTIRVPAALAIAARSHPDRVGRLIASLIVASEELGPAELGLAISESGLSAPVVEHFYQVRAAGGLQRGWERAIASAIADDDRPRASTAAAERHLRSDRPELRVRALGILLVLRGWSVERVVTDLKLNAASFEEAVAAYLEKNEAR